MRGAPDLRGVSEVAGTNKTACSSNLDMHCWQDRFKVHTVRRQSNEEDARSVYEEKEVHSEIEPIHTKRSRNVGAFVPGVASVAINMVSGDVKLTLGFSKLRHYICQPTPRVTRAASLES